MIIYAIHCQYHHQFNAYIIKTPNLWGLLKTLVPNAEKNPQLVLALTTIFKGHLNSQSLLATQLGIYLNSNGVKDAVITQMNRLGLSISVDGIQRRLQLLTTKQKRLIRQVSSRILTTPLIFVYDNIQLSQRVAQARIDSHDQFLKGTSGYLAQAVVGEGRTLPRRDSFMVEAAEKMKVAEILPVSLEDEDFFVDVGIMSLSQSFCLFQIRQSRNLSQSLLMITF